jgi:hypothetical protein
VWTGQFGDENASQRREQAKWVYDSCRFRRQKGNSGEIENGSVEGAPVMAKNSDPDVLVTVTIDGVKYTGQFWPKALYNKHAITRDDISLGKEVDARIDTRVRRGTWTRHWYQDELVLKTSSGEIAWGRIVRKPL